MSDADTDTDEPRMEVKDENDEHSTHKRRKRQLEDLREEAISVRMEAHSQHVGGHVTRQEARQYYRGAVRSYLHNVFQILNADGVSLSADYETGVKLGAVTIDPPSDLVAFARDRMRHLLPGESVPQPVTYEVVGLRDVTELPSPLSHTFSVEYRAGGQVKTRSETVEAEIPQHVLDTAMEVADTAMNEVGVGLEIDQGEPVVKITRDMVEQKVRWQRQNL